jgi:alkanesulfonate monooxygenase SsuD/methylene tetrahydromethanopterin reductase-like flavin-dependent oxidoreductase (luciferase family)
MQSIGAGLEAQVASTHEDAVQLASAVQQRMEDEVSTLHGRVLSLDEVMVSLGQQAEQAEAASVAEATMLRAMFAQQKAESEETMAEKIIPLEDSLRGACFATTSMSRPLILRYCFWLCSPTVSFRRCHRCSILGPCSNY